jgi:hypothetical protein
MPQHIVLRQELYLYTGHQVTISLLVLYQIRTRFTTFGSRRKPIRISSLTLSFLLLVAFLLGLLLGLGIRRRACPRLRAGPGFRCWRILPDSVLRSRIRRRRVRRRPLDCGGLLLRRREWPRTARSSDTRSRSASVDCGSIAPLAYVRRRNSRRPDIGPRLRSRRTLLDLTHRGCFRRTARIGP